MIAVAGSGAGIGRKSVGGVTRKNEVAGKQLNQSVESLAGNLVVKIAGEFFTVVILSSIAGCECCVSPIWVWINIRWMKKKIELSLSILAVKLYGSYDGQWTGRQVGGVPRKTKWAKKRDAECRVTCW
jgi:hypothetical protein